MRTVFHGSQIILDTIDSTNSVVINLLADLKSMFASKINVINDEIV